MVADTDIPRMPIPLQNCIQCPRLVQSRTFVVPPRIIPNAPIMIVGEAPGEQEDAQGLEPFVGPAGETLQSLCLQSGIEYHQVSLANTVCCRPTRMEIQNWNGRVKSFIRNDKPDALEVKRCALNLDNFIALANPRILVAAGGEALKRLTGRAGIVERNGMVMESEKYPGKVIIPMLHPAYVRSNPGLTKDALFAMEQVRKARDNQLSVHPGNYKAATTIELFREMMDELEASEIFAFDIEASGIRDFQNVWIVTMAFSSRTGYGWTLPWRIGTPEFYEAVKADRNKLHPKSGKPVKATMIDNVFEFAKSVGIEDPGFKYYWVEYPEVWERLDKLFRSPRTKIFHNAPYDIKVCQNDHEFQGFKIAGPIRDTMGLHCLLEGQKTRHSLENLSARFTNMGNFKNPIKEWIKYGITEKRAGDTYAIIPPQDLYVYNGGDADATLRLHADFVPQVKERTCRYWDMLNFMDSFLMPVQQLLIEVEEWGVNIDQQALAAGDSQLQIQIKQKEDELFRVCGVKPFNVNSTKQLREVFHDILQFPVMKRTPKGVASTDEETMKLLENEIKHPAPKLLTEHRSLVKLRGTYVLGIAKRLYGDARLHCNFNMWFTDTGRLSSDDPNLQNIPRPRPGEVNIKNFFIPTHPGWKMVATDFGQAELRVSAWEAQDDVAIQMFLDGRDIHNEMACKIFDLPPGSRANKEQRVIAKGINFGIIYGLTAQGVVADLKKEGVIISQDTAQSYLDAVFLSRPKLKEWMDRTIFNAHRTGYVEAATGRRNYLMSINSYEMKDQREAERKGINMPIQSFASDLTLWSALRIDRELKRRGLKDKVKLWNLVHDNIIWEMPEELCVDFLREIAVPNMVNWTTQFFGFPFTVDAEVGDRWGDMLHVCLTCGELSKEEDCPKCAVKNS